MRVSGGTGAYTHDSSRALSTGPIPERLEFQSPEDILDFPRILPRLPWWKLIQSQGADELPQECRVGEAIDHGNFQSGLSASRSSSPRTPSRNFHTPQFQWRAQTSRVAQSPLAKGGYLADETSCTSSRTIRDESQVSDGLARPHSVDRLHSQEMLKEWLRSNVRMKPKKSVVPDLKSKGKMGQASPGLWSAGVNTNHLNLDGMIENCAACRSGFSYDEKAKFCRTCGEKRLDNKQVGEVFSLYTNTRNGLRTSDLIKFTQHVRYLQYFLPKVQRQTLYRIVSEVQQAFDDVLEEQKESGSLYTQGILLEFFPRFLYKISQNQDLPASDLISKLMNEALGRKSHESHEAAENSQVESTATAQQASKRALSALCPKCGAANTSDNNTFCRQCGDKLSEEDREAINVMRGAFERRNQSSVLGSLSTKRTRRASNPQATAEFDMQMSLAKKHDLPVDTVRRKREEFLEYDSNKNGLITRDEFREILRVRCGLADDQDVPEHLSCNFFLKHGIGEIDFEEFLLWSCNTEYCEEFLVTNPEERALRKLARTQGYCLPDVERIKKVFDAFDSDGSGVIEELEFKEIVLSLMKIKNPADVSEKKLKRYWREVDTDMTGDVGFDEFLVWYFNFFEGQQ